VSYSQGRSEGGADKARYFEGGISSVYLWDMDDGFAGCVLLKKGMLNMGGGSARVLT
jgi:hypothetical protein